MSKLEYPFASNFVLEERISNATLRAYSVGFESNEFRLQALVDVIASVIPEFALGFHGGSSIPLPQLREKLKEAATRVFTTPKFERRGEFGELILHLLLRDFCGTIPLISKIWFKDTDNATVHGFDGVHVTIDGSEKKLWLGESKLYTDGASGVKELAKDLETHLSADYLRREFSLITTKLPPDMDEVTYWRDLLHRHRRLESVLDRVVIPMACTYSSDLFRSHSDNTKEYFKDFAEECGRLEGIFSSKKIITNVDVVLMLLPVKCKNELGAELNHRLKSMQAI